MRAIDARSVDAFDALDDVLFAAGRNVAMPWAAAYQDMGAAADDGASNRSSEGPNPDRTDHL